jgi:hypothetical protein
MNYFAKPTLLSETLMEYGLCYTFNLAAIEHFYDLNLVAADFYHQHFTSYNQKAVNITIPRTISLTTSLVIYVNALQTYYDKIFNGLHDGHWIYVHDPFELPTKFSDRFFMHKDVSATLIIEPLHNMIDESLNDLNIVE